MAGKRHDDGRVCLCDQPDGSCAGLAVGRLSRDRVQELAEEIWADRQSRSGGGGALMRQPPSMHSTNNANDHYRAARRSTRRR
jgi:hypothetical protein